MLLSLTVVSRVCCVQKRPRDFCWAKEGDVLPLIEHLEQLQVGQALLAPAHLCCSQCNAAWEMPCRSMSRGVVFVCHSTIMHVQ